METLKLYWLGSPLIELKGRAIKLETRKATALLAYLSLAPGECQREVLATMFWPEGNQQKALANLRRTLSSLNTRLPGWIIADRQTVTLKRNGKLWVDVDAFHQLFSRVKEHPHPERQVCDPCLSILGRAVDLYRGDFVEGVNLTDSPNFDEWQFFQRDGLRQEFAEALQRLSSGHAEREQWEQAITYARRWAALDRLHEPACRALMDLYARSGQRTAALRQYEELERLLQQQLGHEPEIETHRLYEQIQDPKETKRVIGVQETPTAFPLLKTKLYIPAVPHSRVVRSDLLTRLDEVEERALTLISVPAGFGKTTLLAEWIAHTSLPVAWLSLDNGDNDPYRLLAYLLAALESIHEEVGREARQMMQSPQLLPPHVILASLINDLIKVNEPYAMVFDDYQFITERAVHEMLAYLLDHIPSNMHLVISTRADPPLQLGRLRAHDQMLELRTHDLCFDFEETVAFLNEVMSLGVSLEDVETLQARTEGWVVGLQMAALSLKGQQNATEFIRAFSGSHRYVLDYLLEEVLRRQPAHIQTFLMETSILEKLNGPLCEALMTEQWRQSGEGGQAVLEYLERNNLFLISMDDERKWFRYHHLFADLLQARFKQSNPEREAICHQQAARWFAENSYRVEAVDHALVVREFSLAADFIEKFALPLIARNEIITIKRWINALPYEILQNRPRLILYHAWALARLGDVDDLENMLHEAENILNAKPESPDLDELRSHLVQLQAYIANIQSDVDLAIKIALGTKEQPGQAGTFSTDINYLAGFQLGYAYYSKGDLERADEIFHAVAKSAEKFQDIFNTVAAQVEQASIQSLRGNIVQVEEIYERIHHWLAQKVENPALFESILKIHRAHIVLERNQLQEANRLVREGISEASLGFLGNTVAYGYTILANILRAQGDIHQAREAVEYANLQIQEQRTYPRTVKNVKLCQVDQWLAEGNLTAAQKWAREEFQAPYDSVPFYRESEYIVLARVLLARRQFKEASDLLEKMAKAAESGRRAGRLIKINILWALALNGQGLVKEALQMLEKSLVSARPQGYLRIFLDEGPQLENLLRCGKHQSIWPEPALNAYVDKLLASFGKS